MIITVEMASGRIFTRNSDRFAFIPGGGDRGWNDCAEEIHKALEKGDTIVNTAQVAVIRQATPEEIDRAKVHGEVDG